MIYWVPDWFCVFHYVTSVCCGNFCTVDRTRTRTLRLNRRWLPQLLPACLQCTWSKWGEWGWCRWSGETFFDTVASSRCCALRFKLFPSSESNCNGKALYFVKMVREVAQCLFELDVETLLDVECGAPRTTLNKLPKVTRSRGLRYFQHDGLERET